MAAWGRQPWPFDPARHFQTYGYQDLTTIYAPLYRLDMGMLREGYLFRMDKVSLFLWLMGELIGAAFFLFTASRIASRELGLAMQTSRGRLSVLMGCSFVF